VDSDTYRIKAILKVETDIITNIGLTTDIITNIGLAEIFVIMSVASELMLLFLSVTS